MLVVCDRVRSSSLLRVGLECSCRLLISSESQHYKFYQSKMQQFYPGWASDPCCIYAVILV